MKVLSIGPIRICRKQRNRFYTFVQGRNIADLFAANNPPVWCFEVPKIIMCREALKIRCIQKFLKNDEAGLV